MCLINSYIHYILLCKKLSKSKYYFNVPMEFKNSLDGLFQLKFTCDVAVETSVGVAVNWRLDWGWEICFQEGLLSWLLGGGFVFCYVGHRAAWVSLRETWKLSSLQTSEQRARWKPPYHLCHLCHILLITSDSRSSAHTQEKESERICGHILKTSTVYPMATGYLHSSHMQNALTPS